MASVALYGFEIVERVPIEIAATAKTREYLKTKRDKMGHLLSVVAEVTQFPARRDELS